MRHCTQLVLLACLAAAPGCAQNSVARSAAATRAAAPAATTTPMPSQPAPPNAGSSATPSVTGVPRYRAGFRGPRGTQAPAVPGALTITGRGDHTGTGGGPGTPNSDPLAFVPHIRNVLGISPGTPVRVHLKTPISSGTAHNGDMVDGTLAAPLGGVPAGTPVRLTVVATAAAGQMTNVGEISLQIVSVNGQPFLSNVITSVGKQAPTVLADDAPGRGTEALVTPDMTLELPAA